MFACVENSVNGVNPLLQILTVSPSRRALWRRRTLGIGHQSVRQGGRTVGDEWTRLMFKGSQRPLIPPQTLTGKQPSNSRGERGREKKQIHCLNLPCQNKTDYIITVWHKLEGFLKYLKI